MPHHWGSLRVQFMLLVILATVPALALTAFRTAQDRTRELVSAQENALSAVRFVADEHERLMRQTDNLLTELGQDPGILAHDVQACSARFSDLPSHYPLYANLIAFDRAGTVLCSSSPLPQAKNFFNSLWFQRALSARDPVVGDYETIRADGRSGQPVALSIRDAAGQVQVVLAAAFDPEWLGDYVAETQVASGTTITLLDRKSTVLTRYPDWARWTGKLWGDPSIRLSIGAEEAVSEGQDLDGTSRVFAAVPLGDTVAPAGSAIAGIPVEQAFASSSVNLWRSVALIAAATAFVLGVTWFTDKLLVGRQVRALADTTRAIAGGRIQTRTGLATTSGELGDLAASIDQMAEALERREQARQDMEASLVESEELYRDLFENASDLILSVAADGKITYANKAWRETLGYDVSDPAGLSFFDAVDPKDRAEAERMFERVMSGERLAQVELTFVARDGRGIQSEGSANCRFVDGRPSALRGIFRDVTLRKQAEAKLRYLSSHDALTGLYNRGYFEEEMNRLTHSRRFPISIVVADVDGLKQTNDTLGHTAGDELLKQAAQILRSSFREEDMIARIGGDEFAVLLPQSNTAVAEEAIARLRQNTTARNDSGVTPLLHLSLGTATASSGDLLTETLTSADAAMYADKSSRQTHRDRKR